jgi:hypothetical protein
MPLETIPSPVYVNGFLTQLKQKLPQALAQGNGVREKHKWLHNVIKKLAGGTEIESTSAIPKGLGRPEVAYQVWQTVEQDGGKVFARSGD